MSTHHDLTSRRDRLSAAKLALLEKRLQGEVKDPTRLPVIPRRADPGPARLSFAQERLWFLHQLIPASPAYHMPQVLHLEGPLDRAALEQSLNRIIARHEILRTVFVTANNRVIQQTLPAFNLPLPVVEVPADQEEILKQLILQEVQQPFDLANGPLLRAKLLQQGPDDHFLILTVHHIIFDEWSNEIFWRELSALYPAVVAGEPSPLEPLPLHYADFAQWQRRELQSGALETQLAYWRKQLAGELPRLQLPFARPRPAVQTFNGALTALPLPRELAEALHSLSRQAGTTLFMTLLAAFKVLLYRYSSQADLLVGIPVTHRNRPELEGLIGLFLNTLVIRSQIEDKSTFLEFLEQIRQTALEAYAQPDLPFEKLVDTLNPARDPAYPPLFQVMFVYQQASDRNLDLPRLKVSQGLVDAGVAKFDLTLFMGETKEGLTATIEYNTDLFEAETMARMLGHFQILLKAIVVEPDQPVSTLSLLTKAERQQLLLEWNDTGLDYPRTACIHHLIEAQVVREPEAIAVQFEGAALTYRDLDYRANQLARQLQARGVGPGVPVAILMERSLEIMVAILGVLKAGGAYLPLDPTYPAERIAFMLADSGAPVWLTQQRLLEALPAAEAETLCLDSDWATIAQASGQPPEAGVTAEDLAYIIYTSGSTGQPKGVQITHRNLVHSTVARLNYYPEPVTCFLLLSSFAFDSSMVGIFGTLCQGGTLLLPPQRLELDVQQMAGLIADYRITHLLSLPAWYQLLLNETGPQHLSSLQVVIVAGEACPGTLGEQHYKLLPETSLYNEYGPTEATVWSTVYRVSPGQADQQVPIGRPIANTQLYLLDQHRQPVPVGVPGEVYLGGEGLSPGYLNRPDLTAERFIPHPFSSDPQARLYKTGDLARYRPDGILEFLGRVDHQVKVRGYRVELGEIEAALTQHPLVREAVVVVHDENQSHSEAKERWGDPAATATLVEALSKLPAASAERLLAEIELLPEEMVTNLLAERKDR